MKGTTNIPVIDLIFRKDGKILFVKRQNTGYKDGFYGLPGGHVDPGESYLQAACREGLEEVGIQLKPEQLKYLMTFQAYAEDSTRTGIYFEVTSWEGEPYNAEPHVHSEIAWFDENNLPDTIMETTLMKIKVMQSGQSYIEYGWQTN
jgi:ADP-ribose pyrophosphatase YjhB (NUDIX family)